MEQRNNSEKKSGPLTRLAGDCAPKEVGFFVLLLLLALLLRLVGIGTPSLWLDEGHSLEPAWTFEQSILDSALQANKPPLYYYLLWLWIEVFGLSETALRMLSVVFSMATVAAVFCLARCRLNATAGWVAGLVCALAPLEIVYSQQVRYYSLLSLLGLLSFWALLRATDKYSPARWLLWIVLTVLLFYTHSTAVLVIGVECAIGLGLALRRFWRGDKSALLYWSGAVLVVGLLVLPWVLRSFLMVSSAQEHYSWMQNIWPGAPPLSAFADTLLNLTAGMGYRALHQMSLGSPWWALVTLVLVPLALLAVVPVRLFFIPAVSPKKMQQVVVMAAMFGLPLLLQFAVSHLFFNIYLPGRTDVAALPMLALLIGFGASRLLTSSLQRRRDRVRTVVLVLSAPLFVVMLANIQLRYYGGLDHPSRVLERQMGERVVAHMTAQDQIVLAGPAAPTLSFYLKRQKPEIRQHRYPFVYHESPYVMNRALPAERFEENVAQLRQRLKQGEMPEGRLFVVLLAAPVPDATKEQQQQLLDRLGQIYGRPQMVMGMQQKRPAYQSVFLVFQKN